MSNFDMGQIYFDSQLGNYLLAVHEPSHREQFISASKFNLKSSLKGDVLVFGSLGKERGGMYDPLSQTSVAAVGHVDLETLASVDDDILLNMAWISPTQAQLQAKLNDKSIRAVLPVNFYSHYHLRCP
ncbi:MAG TPA: hypothetical protein VJJ52_04720 [Candidatus Nanoarchaeia archaeon]|nr:hypothetical protein [Candidatus Nanoarchaeia archaeon]